MSIMELKNKAALCYRLSRSVNSPTDVALLAALDAEAEKAAAEMEVKEKARLAEPNKAV